MPPKKKSAITDYFQLKNSKTKKPVEQEESKNELEEEKAEEVPVGSGIKERTDIHDFPPFDEFVDGLQTWKPLLKQYTSSKTFRETYDFCKDQYKKNECYPPSHLIFNCFSTTQLKNLKVIIVGQDPYHGQGQAMGLCFSVPKTQKIPPSLSNMYKCMQNDKNMKKFAKPSHGDLTKWAQQGVFMLNDLLTVTKATPASHKNSKWNKFTDEVIRLINTNCDGCVFLLWGKPAQKKGAVVNSNKHYVIKTSHPSPFSANAGFLTSTQFSDCNKYLAKMGKEEINWNWE